MAKKTDKPGSLKRVGDGAETPPELVSPEEIRERAESTLSSYLRWAESLAGPHAFRGHANAAWLLESSAFRRLKKDRDIPANFVGYVFTGYLDDMVNKARVRFPEHYQSSALEIMALLQHQGGATGLIDFTESPLVALWFACQDDENNLPLKPSGKVFAASLGGEGISEVRTKDVFRQEVDEFFPVDSKRLWFWRPGHDHRRMLFQQSVFVFGRPGIDEFAGIDSREIPAAEKAVLIRMLETMGVSERTLFSDFAGFADANAWHKEYSPRDAEAYYTGKIERAKTPAESMAAYVHRGIFRFIIEDRQGAVADWKKAKRLAEQSGNKDVANQAARALAKHDKPE